MTSPTSLDNPNTGYSTRPVVTPMGTTLPLAKGSKWTTNGCDGAFVVGGDDDGLGPARHGAFPHVAQQRLAGEFEQRLAGQAAGAVARRDVDAETQEASFSTSVSDSSRASSSSITGIPSRIG